MREPVNLSSFRHLVSIVALGAVGALLSGCAATKTASTPAAPAAGPTLVAVMHPVNQTTGAIDAKIDLGTVKFTQGAGKVDVLAELNGISVAESEPEASADGQGVYYPHGIHVHEGSGCGPTEKDGKVVPAGGAGGHLDPLSSKSHQGPQGSGHAGDLPNIRILSDGSGILMTATNRLTLEQLKGRSVVLHAKRDNYTDNPPSGGSGARIACGVIEAK